MKNYFLYARVSSKEQEREGYSIPAQVKLIKKYADSNSIKIVESFIDVETAKVAGRKDFEKMVEKLKGNSDIEGIICEKTDRLYRNLKDWVTLDDLGITLVFVKEGVIGKDSTSDAKFMHGIRVLMAKKYIDNLSEEVKKGVREKVLQGGFPHMAPTGYLNVNKEIVPDSQRAFFVKRAYEMYASANYSLKEIAEELNDKGFRTRNGKKVHKSNIDQMLKNPTYYGKILYNGQIYDGNHKPIVSESLFNKVQENFNCTSRPRSYKHTFPLRGFIVCGECGCKITAEVQKGHVYYRCTKSKGNCSQRYIREEAIVKEISAVLANLELDEEIVSLLMRATKEANKDEYSYHKQTVEALDKQLKEVQKQMERLLDLAVEGTISGNLLENKLEELKKQKKELKSNLSKNDNAQDACFEQIEEIIKTASSCRNLFETGNDEIKKKVLANISSNLVLKDKKIASYQLKEPYNLFLNKPKTAKNSEWLSMTVWNISGKK